MPPAGHPSDFSVYQKTIAEIHFAGSTKSSTYGNALSVEPIAKLPSDIGIAAVHDSQ